MKICIYVSIILIFLEICSLAQQDSSTSATQPSVQDYYRRKSNTHRNNKFKKPPRKPSKKKKPNQGRIIGGDETSISRFPFVAAIIRMNNEGMDFIAGASIISLRWIVTSAEAGRTLETYNYIEEKRAYVHSNSTRWDKDYRAHRIVKAHYHEKYNVRKQYARHDDDYNPDYDIGVAKVKEPFDGVYEKRIPYVKRTYNYFPEGIPKVRVGIVGWGTIKPDAKKEDATAEHVLRHVTLFLQKKEDCDVGKTQNKFLTERMICAVTDEPDPERKRKKKRIVKGPCYGDQGGPLFVQDDTVEIGYRLIGIISWWHYCGVTNHPSSIHSKLSEYYSWIRSKICKNNTEYRDSIYRSHVHSRHEL